jgi:hypothetical protein
MLLIVAVIVVFIVLALLNTGGTAGCRWREDRTADPVDGLSFWRCQVCGATEKTPRGRPPNVCRAPR